ncbi:MAG: Ig-like domain-containing protein, partial [Patescibacteria group bacterium]
MIGKFKKAFFWVLLIGSFLGSITVNAADTVPPTVSIGSPASSATVSGTITLLANATDDVGVVGVQFKIDGNNMGAEQTVYPYDAPWNTANFSNGSHTITATARDAASNTRTSSGVAVTVSNGSVTNSAQYVNQNVPATMTVGQKYYVNVTFKNTGTSTWTRNDAFKLGSQFPQDNTTWGANRFYLETSDTVAPGQSKTFTMPITAPSSPGTYIFQWRMVKELVGWFGDFSRSISVTVSPPGPENLSPNGNFISSGTGLVTLSWSPSAGAARYSLGVTDYTEPGLKDPRNNCSGYYLCQSDISGTSISLPVKPGHVYFWWVTAKNAAGQSSIAENSIFAVETDAIIDSSDKLVGPVVFHNFRYRG